MVTVNLISKECDDECRVKDIFYPVVCAFIALQHVPEGKHSNNQ